MTGMIVRTLDGIVESLGLIERPSFELTDSATGQQAQFQALRRVSAQAKSISGVLDDLGVDVPHAAITHVERFFDACESMMNE